MSDTPLHSVSVAGVTFDDAGRVLLIKRRDNGQWQAPGGVLELNETFEHGVIREVFEETGVHVAADRLTGVYKNLVKGVVALVYRCSYISGTPSSTEESSEVAWVDAREAASRMSPAFAVRISDATRSDDEQPASRAHDGSEVLE